MPLSLNQQLGNYRIVRVLGEGGMGVVYEALHEQLQKRAAIKVLHPQLSQDPEFAARFLNEGRAVNLVGHPALVNIFECGRLPDGALYIVMEYLEGEPLLRRMATGAMTLGEALRVTRQLASALHAAHQKGIVHRDLKPENVMVVPDPEAAGGERVKVLDFGIAKVGGAEKDGVRTRTGVVMGTPLYMSPEQCHGAAAVDGQSDVYSLGVMLYEMLGGAPPFAADGTGLIMAKHIFQEPRPLGELNPVLSPALLRLVHAMLAKQPTERPTMAQVAEALTGLGAQRTAAIDLTLLPEGSNDTPLRTLRSAPGGGTRLGHPAQAVRPAPSSPASSLPPPVAAPIPATTPGGLRPYAPTPTAPPTAATIAISGAAPGTTSGGAGQGPASHPGAVAATPVPTGVPGVGGYTPTGVDRPGASVASPGVSSTPSGTASAASTPNVAAASAVSQPGQPGWSSTPVGAAPSQPGVIPPASAASQPGWSSTPVGAAPSHPGFVSAASAASQPSVPSRPSLPSAPTPSASSRSGRTEAPPEPPAPRSRLPLLAGALAVLAAVAGGAGSYAVFGRAARVALTVQRQGLGTVISEPPGIYCGDLCNIALPSGTLVKLVPQPDPGMRFAGWTGACTGEGACGLYLNRPLTVGARFVPR